MSVAELLKKKREAQARLNAQQGAEFLAQFKQQDNVVVLETGIAYQVLVQGNGGYPKVTDSIRCHYQGSTIAGDIFDSSVARGEPAVFRLNKLIQAYQQVLPLVAVGSKIKLVTPAQYAYGEEAINKWIGPNSTLVFEVELLAIEP